MTDPSPVFGRVPHPPCVTLICDKPYDGAGYNTVPPRSIVGVCSHETWGYGDGQFYHDFFSTGGARALDALVDYYIDNDGTITMLNEPRGTRSPWANGGSDGLEGDGPAFVRALGVGAINARLVSIEHEGKESPYTEEQIRSHAMLAAYWFDQAKVSWNSYPLHDRLQVVTDIEHFEFATKSCPFGPKRGQVNERQDRVRGVLKYWQRDSLVSPAPTPDPVPPPSPIENPGHEWWPEGYTVEALASRFGILTHELENGREVKALFDPNGVISNAWVARGGRERLAVDDLPRPLKWWTLEALGAEAREIIAFERNWTLQRVGARGGFMWV